MSKYVSIAHTYLIQLQNWVLMLGTSFEPVEVLATRFLESKCCWTSVQGVV